MSIGGRFGEADCAETANTQIAVLDFDDVPMICEVRNLGSRKDGSIGKYRDIDRGIVIDCERTRHELLELPVHQLVSRLQR